MNDLKSIIVIIKDDSDLYWIAEKLGENGVNIKNILPLLGVITATVDSSIIEDIKSLKIFGDNVVLEEEKIAYIN